MARKDIGNLATDGEKQPGSNIVTKNDDTLEATLVYKIDAINFDSLPTIGTDHPDDARLECVNVAKSYDGNSILTATCSYFGINGNKSKQQISYAGGYNTDPIETHKNFDDLTDSGNYQYDADGFFTGFPTGELKGVQSYLTPSSTVTISVWRREAPDIKKRVQIFDKLPGEAGELPWPSDIENWLLIDTPYRKYGSFYQLSEVFLGSGAKGWQTEIYP